MSNSRYLERQTVFVSLRFQNTVEACAFSYRSVFTCPPWTLTPSRYVRKRKPFYAFSPNVPHNKTIENGIGSFKTLRFNPLSHYMKLQFLNRFQSSAKMV